MAVRGYVSYRPQAEAAHWLLKARDVINAYEEYWPLTVRQVFYRMVAEHGYAKTEDDYKKLAKIIARARRAHLIDFKSIRDDSMRYEDPHFYTDESAFNKVVLNAAKAFRLDRQKGQDQVVEMWCEAAGMVPILKDIAAPYSIRVSSGGGYDSVTSKHLLATRVLERAKEGRRTVVLHVGDFDGSGEDMAEVMHEDVLHMGIQQIVWADTFNDADSDDTVRVARAAKYFRLDRVALTEEQVIDYDVETAPPKPSDSRSARFVRKHPDLVEHLGSTHISAQLEALTPPQLTAVLRSAIEGYIDLDAYEAVLEEEEEIRNAIVEKIGDDEAR